MKTLKIFYQTHCPFCVKAFKYIKELKEEHPEYAAIHIETIEETEHPEIADKYDYYYVPTFYIGNEKVHEAGIFKPEVDAILRKVLES